MKIYLSYVDGEYKLQASDKKVTLKKRLEDRVAKLHEGRIKSTLEKYVDRMENSEELTLKMAYSFENLEIVYSGISEDEAKKKCEDMSKAYFKKNIIPMIFYGLLCPVTFVIAPFVPILNWGFSFYFGYKFSSKYRGIKGYNKILNSKFVKEEIIDLEEIVKTS